MHHTLPGLRQLLVIVFLTMGLSGPVWGQSIWQASISTDWHTALNWSAGVPTSSVSATFNDLTNPLDQLITLSAAADASFLLFNANNNPYQISGPHTLTLSSATNTITQSGSAAVTINSAVVTSGNFQFIASGTGTVTLAGAVTVGTGADVIDKRGLATLTFTNTVTAGSVTVNRGNLVLAGNGQLLGISGISLQAGINQSLNTTSNPFARFVLDNSATAHSDRIADTAGLQFQSGGGFFEMIGNGSTAVTEVLGPLAVTGGSAAIGVITVTPHLSTPQATVLEFSNLVAPAASNFTAIHFASGSPTALGAPGSNPRITFTTAPANNPAGILGGWATTGTSSPSDTHWAVSGTHGITPLDSSLYVPLPPSAPPATTTHYQAVANVTLTGAVSGATLRLAPTGSQPQVINLGSNNLTVNYGGAIKVGAADTIIRGSGSILNNNTNQQMFNWHVAEGTLYVQSGFSATRIAKSGSGRLVLSITSAPGYMNTNLPISGTLEVHTPNAGTITVTGRLFGQGDYVKSGQGTLSLTHASNSHSLIGSLIITGGTLSIGSTGSVTNFPFIAGTLVSTIDSPGRLFLDNSLALNADRIRGGLTFANGGGTIQRNGIIDGGASIENLDFAIVESGFATFHVDKPFQTSPAALGLRFTTLERNPGTAFHFHGTDANASPQAMGTAGSAPRVVFTNGMVNSTSTLFRFTSGPNGTTGGFATINPLGSITPDSVTWAAYQGTGTAANGARAMTAAGFTTLTITSGGSTTANYTTNASVTLTGNLDVGTLRLNPTSAQTFDLAGNDLRFTGVGLLKTNTANTTITGSGGQIVALGPANELIFHVWDSGTLTVNVPINASYFTKAGNGGMTLVLPATTPGYFSNEIGIQGSLTLDTDGHSHTLPSRLVGPGTLIKTGLGTLNLASTDALGNIYAGGTQVNGGTLRVNTTSTASGTGAGAVTVNAGGILGGIGSIIPNTGSLATNLVTVNSGGILDPGVTNGVIGTLTVGSLVHLATFQLNGTYRPDVAGSSGSDTVAIAGDLQLAATSVLDLTTPTNTYDPSLSYVLFSYTGTLTGTFGSTPGLPVSHYIDYDVPLVGGVSAVVLTPIPEPNIGLFISGAALAGLVWRRRSLRLATTSRDA